MMRQPSELTSAYFDDELADGEFGNLTDWMHADATHMRQFVRESLLHSRLRDILQQHDVCGLFDEDGDESSWVEPSHIVSLLDEEAAAAERRARESEEQAQREAEASTRRHELDLDRRNLRTEPARISPRWYVGAVIAATLLIVFGRSLLPTPELAPAKQPPLASAPPVIATITKSLEARWEDVKLSVAAGTPLTAGRLSLETGVVEIEFGAGAKLVIEGPAALQLVTSDRARLDRGRVVANVPQHALGFTLHSSAAAFIDLGTEFGVEVSETGAASIHVLDGEVALVRGDRKDTGPSKTLQVGAANLVSADGSTVEEITFDRAHFIRRVPASAYELAVRKSRPLAYWRLSEEADRGVVESSGRIPSPGTPTAGVQLGAESVHSSRGRAALFSSGHNGIELGRVSELDLAKSFTCEAWARNLPREGGATGIGPQRILSTFDRMPRTGFAFGLVDGPWYKLPEPGLMLHFTVHGVYDCVSVEGTAAGEWTHLTAVVDESGEPTLYIDGKQAGERYRPQRARGEADADAGRNWVAAGDWKSALIGTPSPGPALLGRNPPGNDAKAPPEWFEGWLSDVAVYDRALGEDEIRRHYETVDFNVDGKGRP
jgi:hypothetical protein